MHRFSVPLPIEEHQKPIREHLHSRDAMHPHIDARGHVEDAIAGP